MRASDPIWGSGRTSWRWGKDKKEKKVRIISNTGVKVGDSRGEWKENGVITFALEKPPRSYKGERAGQVNFEFLDKQHSPSPD